MFRILFVDDDIQYQDVIKELLELENYEVITANNAADGLQLFKESEFDLVISDLKMEKIDGMQFLTILRKLNSKVKVIILTGSENDNAEIKCLDMSVNDYVKKPVSLDVLLKRIEIVLSKTNIEASSNRNVSEAGNLEVDMKKRRVYLDGKFVAITTMEYNLLVFFLENRNVIFSRSEILRHVWKINENYADLRTIDTHVKKLRAKLNLSCIYSVRGVGYE